MHLSYPDIVFDLTIKLEYEFRSTGSKQNRIEACTNSAQNSLVTDWSRSWEFSPFFLQVMSAHSNYVRIRVPAPGSINHISSESDKEEEKSLLLDDGEVSEEILWGTAGGETVELLCTARGLLKKMSQRVFVGDMVHVINIDWVMGQGTNSYIPSCSTDFWQQKWKYVTLRFEVWHSIRHQWIFFSCLICHMQTYPRCNVSTECLYRRKWAPSWLCC